MEPKRDLELAGAGHKKETLHGEVSRPEQGELSNGQILDIEHVSVEDDPRKWSSSRKRFTLAIISCASLLLTISVNIYNPAINDIEKDLRASSEDISWTISVNALVNGFSPLLWGAFTELYGRKLIYLVSISLFMVGSGVAGAAKSVTTLIVMRIIQAAGSSAILTLGAATLADIYDPKERGTVMGIYYATPLLGPALGPVIGGAATSLFDWRATFYFLVILGALALLTFFFFKDTFRRERSLSYQSALREALKRKGVTAATNEGPVAMNKDGTHATLEDTKVSLKDIHMARPILLVLRRTNNLCILFVSGMIFGPITYCLTYTSVLTFSRAPYHYGSLRIGLVLLSFGIGSMIGSIVGGRWSDWTLRKIRLRNNGVSKSEDRLKSTLPIMPILPASLVAYAWLTDKKVHIAPICIALFFAGLSSLWIYACVLTYVVDANAGRSSSAVASNSLFRGIFAFGAIEVSVPLQNALGDGGMYTFIGGLTLFGVCGVILLLIAKGGGWRETAERKENEKEEQAGPLFNSP